MIKIISYVKACCVLHNLLIHHSIPSEWIQQEEDEEADAVENILFEMMTANATLTRRQQVHHYLQLKLR